MQREEVISKFDGRSPIYVDADDVVLSDFREYANANLGFDKKTMDTFYYLPLKENIDDDIIDKLLDGGWALNEDKNCFVVYLKF